MREEPFGLRIEGFDLRGALFVPRGEGAHPGLIISHGIPAGVQDSLDRGYPALAERFCEQGFLTAVFNYRGCGLSGGEFEIRGWTRDLAAVTGFLLARQDLDARCLVLMGFSGGAATSLSFEPTPGIHVSPPRPGKPRTPPGWNRIPRPLSVCPWRPGIGT